MWSAHSLEARHDLRACPMQVWLSQKEKQSCQTLQRILSGQDSAARSSRRRSRGKPGESDNT